MDNNINELINKFKDISDLRYVKSSSNGTGAIGLTFERLLGKKSDNMYFPDFYDIEIKCTSRFSRYPISLFSIAFDGPTFPEINRIIEKYGYFDKIYKDKKIFNTTLYYNRKKHVNNYFFNLEIDEFDEKLYLCVYDENMNLIEKESFVYLDTIINHIKLKINKLAIVYASIKRNDDTTYFRYYKISIYKLKNYNTFFNLLKEDIIKVELSSTISKSGIDKGKYKNKNLIFKINKDDILELFDLVTEYDHDE